MVALIRRMIFSWKHISCPYGQKWKYFYEVFFSVRKNTLALILKKCQPPNMTPRGQALIFRTLSKQSLPEKREIMEGLRTMSRPKMIPLFIQNLKMHLRRQHNPSANLSLQIGGDTLPPHVSVSQHSDHSTLKSFCLPPPTPVETSRKESWAHYIL